MRLRMLGVVAAVAASEECCWCDDDTPVHARTVIGSDSQVYKLVFSDEFNNPKRNFANGKDSKWTALDIGDTSNKGAAFYLPEQATVVTDGKVSALRILTENASHTGDGPEGEKGIKMPFKSAMLQGWNKFCFTGGIVEFRAKQPRGGGYWPALWAFGNLGRAVYQKSNTGLWPWSYDKCDDDLVLPPSDPPQRISACMDQPPFEESGLHPFQGRGATELDVLEGAVTNTGLGSYAVGSLQLSPGVPAYFRPPLFGFPTESGPGSWYAGLKFGERGKPNNGWYGPPWGELCPTGCPDALSGGLTEIDDFDTRYWDFRMEWKLGPDGHLSWFYDGDFVWGMTAASFDEYSVCSGAGGKQTCQRTPARQIPQEPMSLVMNTAIGTWNGGATALDGKHWPASLMVDYVRVWQRPSEVSVGCNPPDFPTKTYIEKNTDLFGELSAPTGYETCPEVYPESAYANAEKIRERAARMRATAAASGAAAATPTLVATTLATETGGRPSSALFPALAGAGVLAAVGAAVWHRASRRGTGALANLAEDEAELEGVYYPATFGNAD